MAVRQDNRLIQELAEEIADRFGRDPKRLLDIFWAVQDLVHWVPPQALRALAPLLELSVLELRDTLTFYHFFHAEPTAEHKVYVDSSALAEIAGSEAILRCFEEELGVRCGAPTVSDNYAVFRTSCMGMSDQLPAALVDGVPVTALTPAKVKQVCADLRRGLAPTPQVVNTVQTRGPVLLVQPSPQRGEVLDQLGRLEPAELIATITQAGLRGRGGAGFATGKKWELCAAQEASARYVICNADEGEPGTFKDRYLLTEQFDRVIEGMILGAFAIGAAQGFIYLRAEYRYLLASLEDHLAQFRTQGLLGANIAGVDGLYFDIRIQLGAGSYVVGEETALLESLEGKRGEPRVRPPFPVEQGYLGKPTIVNNVETFASVVSIVLRGAPVFAALGTTYSKGSKLLSVAGDCERPGIHEIEWGQTLGEFLAMVEARDTQAVVVGGPSGAIVGPDSLDRRLCLEDLPTGGSMMVLDRSRDILEVVRNFTRFFVEETCGCCVPCRSGTVVFNEQIDLILRGEGAKADLQRILDWSAIVRATARCGLGQSCTNPLTTSIRAFRKLFEDRVQDHEAAFRPFDVSLKTAQYEETIASYDARRS